MVKGPQVFIKGKLCRQDMTQEEADILETADAWNSWQFGKIMDAMEANGGEPVEVNGTEEENAAQINGFTVGFRGHLDISDQYRDRPDLLARYQEGLADSRRYLELNDKPVSSGDGHDH